MKYLFKRDTLLVTLSVFILFGLFLALPFNVHFLQPIKNVLYDFDYYDLTYSKLKKADASFDSRIVIVNIGDTDRAGISAIVQKLNTYQPKVIGLDVLFKQHKDPHVDSVLVATIKNTPNIVLCSEMTDDGPSGLFNKYAAHNGYANFYGEKGHVVRYFAPVRPIGATVYKSFATAITSIADTQANTILRHRHHQVEPIHYTRHQSKYMVIQYTDLLNDRVSADALNNKIVLVGLVSNNPYNIEDKFFTPMNTQFFGKSTPDNFGVVIHANIVSMILDQDYVYAVPWWLNWLIAILLGWLYIAVFVRYFIDKHIWFHLVVSCIEIISIILFILISILLFDHFNIRIDLTETFGVLLMSSWILYLYHGLAVWMHDRFKMKTIFHNPNHK